MRQIDYCHKIPATYNGNSRGKREERKKQW